MAQAIGRKVPIKIRSVLTKSRARLSEMSQIICPYCFERIEFLGSLCPKCGERLPRSLQGGNLMFSIVGSTAAGKSHYIAVLIKELQAQAGKFGFSITPANDETMSLYDRRFKRPIYNQGVTIHKTATNDAEARRPLIYTLDFYLSVPNKRATLIFYDAAGERFNSQDDMERETRYLANSAGIIFLVDPLQLPQIREHYLRKFPDEEASLPSEPTSAAEVGQIFTRLIRVMETRYGTSAQFSVPLAITLSKIDALRYLLTNEAPVFLPPRHTSGVSEGDVRRNNDYFRNFLTLEPLISNNIRRFQRVACFGVSALGQNPQKTDSLQFQPRPIRPLDPILWILWAYGLIQKR